MQAHSRHLHRLQKLKAHHDSCEKRYEKANTKRLNDERERTLFLHDKLNTMVSCTTLFYNVHQTDRRERTVPLSLLLLFHLFWVRKAKMSGCTMQRQERAVHVWLALCIRQASLSILKILLRDLLWTVFSVRLRKTKWRCDFWSGLYLSSRWLPNKWLISQSFVPSPCFLVKPVIHSKNQIIPLLTVKVHIFGWPHRKCNAAHVKWSKIVILLEKLL